MLGPFCVCLEGTKREIAKDTEDRRDGERGVDGGRWQPGPTEGFTLQKAAIAEDAISCGEGKQQRDEGVEV